MEDIILFLIIVAGAYIYNILSWGLLLYKFWYWFILPVFSMLPQLTFIQAIGIWFFITLFHDIPTQVIQKEYLDEKTGQILSIIAPWIILTLGGITWLIFFN